ncbi:DUF2304 domain-containing protein [Microbacterium sp. CFH 31415]|uniref:DUF2304 domain-containing protein n=1 Tax=Microbacterium sp. CFH 31415 TaxID=2921732 RepID=UPI001F140A13|nr:DUF2304 domain-containing protein [Microbacterium sp. CFH 31415]MCH6231357.1 DUF2304 domain-containing protein [Microbacterium sp. CFH 31415]
MNPMTYAFGIAAALLALVAIIELMRRATLRERHAVWWLVGGVIALVVAIFPQTLTWAARLLGIAVPTNLVFFIAIGLLFLVSLQYGAELTRVEDKIRTLAEQSAFHEQRLAELERAGRSGGADAAATPTPPAETAADDTADDRSDGRR